MAKSKLMFMLARFPRTWYIEHRKGENIEVATPNKCLALTFYKVRRHYLR